MNKRIKKIFLALLFLSFYANGQVRYELPVGSKLNWHGETIVHSEHDGTLAFRSGYVWVDNNFITQGVFNIDMQSMFSLDEKTGKDIEGLSDHLKSDDFFSTEKFPTAYFSFSTMTPTEKKDQYQVKGFLTIKGIMNQIEFPASIVINEKKVLVKADVVIDRLMWNITYQSRNFLGNLKDTAIADNIVIKMDLSLEKK